MDGGASTLPIYNALYNSIGHLLVALLVSIVFSLAWMYTIASFTRVSHIQCDWLKTCVIVSVIIAPSLGIGSFVYNVIDYKYNYSQPEVVSGLSRYIEFDCLHEFPCIFIYTNACFCCVLRILDLPTEAHCAYHQNTRGIHNFTIQSLTSSSQEHL